LHSFPARPSLPYIPPAVICIPCQPAASSPQQSGQQEDGYKQKEAPGFFTAISHTVLLDILLSILQDNKKGWVVRSPACTKLDLRRPCLPKMPYVLRQSNHSLQAAEAIRGRGLGIRKLEANLARAGAFSLNLASICFHTQIV